MTFGHLAQTHVGTFAQAELDRGMAVKTANNRLTMFSTLIKQVKRERSRLRFKLDGLVGEIGAVEAADMQKRLASRRHWLRSPRVVCGVIAEADGEFVMYDRLSETVNQM